MPDRATHLAKQLLERMRNLEAAWTEERIDEAEKNRRRQEQVAKVLAISAGVTDGFTVQRITGALPTLDAQRNLPDRDRAELADFLRQHIRFE